MSERRLDPFTGRSIVLAPGRRGLGAAKPGGLPAPAGRCPFCPGHEADTEETLARWPEDGPWRVRVVRNKYPLASLPDGDHEIGIDDASHDTDLDDLSPDHGLALWRLYRDRVAALSTRHREVLFFRNRGRRAGSSQPHPHSQVVAIDWEPADLAIRRELARAHERERGVPLYAAELARERASERVLWSDEALLTHCPFAPTRPYEVRFVPTAPRGRFADATDAELRALSRRVADAIRRLKAVGVRDYNLILRQVDRWWHLELLPRTGGDAGFELSTGDMIVVVPPEDAARALRGDAAS